MRNINLLLTGAVVMREASAATASERPRPRAPAGIARHGVRDRGADGNHLENASLDPRDDDTLKRL